METKTAIAPYHLLSFGYKEFPVSSIDKCTKNWGKVIRDKSGRHIYQIVIRYWLFDRFGSYDSQVCLTYPGDNTAWITYRGDSIENIEAYFDKLFHSTGAIAYYKRDEE